MIHSVVLMLYVAAVAIVVVPVLRRAQWVDHAPGYALWTWIALSYSLVLSAVLAVLSLCLGVLATRTPLQANVAACLRALTGQDGLPCAVLAGLSLCGFVGGAGRLLLVLVRKAWHSYEVRRQQATALRLLGRTDHELGAVVIEDPQAAAYCVPGRARRIVLTTAAYERLTSTQLRAVLAHERAHLNGKHALLRTLGTLPARLLPGLPATRDAAHAVTRLLEYRADDAACRHAPRITLAEALLKLATPASTSVLNAAGTATADRITRLLRSSGHANGPRLGTVVSTATATLMAPALLTAMTTALTGPGSACPFFSGLTC